MTRDEFKEIAATATQMLYNLSKTVEDIGEPYSITLWWSENEDNQMTHFECRVFDKDIEQAMKIETYDFADHKKEIVAGKAEIA